MANEFTRNLYRFSQAARVAWFGSHHVIANRIGRGTAFAEGGVKVESDYPDRRLFFAEMQKLFERDWKNIEDGLYAAPAAIDRNAFTAFHDSFDFLRDVPEVARRRRDQVHDEVKAEEPRQGFPDYYMQNFHFQTGGWLSDESARRYDFQVETLFAGTADAMRRQALVPISAFMKRKDQRKLCLLDVATGTGRFLAGVKDNWPRLAVTALDMSPEYIARARKELKAWRDVRFLEANAEAIPVLKESQDIVTCIYLFHELPPEIRQRVAREIARVLKPGGLFVLVDSIQPGDTPGFEALTEFFPQAFHEPYYESYLSWDIPHAFAMAGLKPQSSTPAFLSKVAVFRK
jgi:ubiquinone/menaquinone biosynthesis C-methylase UbiE